MAEEVKSTDNQSALTTTDLAYERNMLAYERTLMAWVRTSISLMSFGFTIYKFFQEMHKGDPAQSRLLTPRLVGMIMISFAMIALVLAQWQHRIAVKTLKHHYPKNQKSLSSLIAMLVLIFGMFLFLGTLFRQ